MTTLPRGLSPMEASGPNNESTLPYTGSSLSPPTLPGGRFSYFQLAFGARRTLPNTSRPLSAIHPSDPQVFQPLSTKG